MKGRLFLVSLLVIGLTFLLTWAAAAREAGARPASPIPSSNRTEYRAVRPDTGNPGAPSDITSTTAFTSYLPLVLNSYAACAIVPTLISPADTSVLDTLIPVLKWYSGDNPNATWLDYQLARDADFAHIIESFQTSVTSGDGESRRDGNLDPANVYYWRAWLECGEIQGPYTKVWSFTTGSGGTLLPSPTLLSPGNGNAVPSTKVTLQWESVPGAVEYRPWWHDISESAYYYDYVNSTQKTPFSSLNANATYEWGVRARNDYGWGAWSVVWQFTTPAGTAAPSSQYLEPNLVTLEEGLTGLTVEERSHK